MKSTVFMLQPDFFDCALSILAETAAPEVDRRMRILYGPSGSRLANARGSLSRFIAYTMDRGYYEMDRDRLVPELLKHIEKGAVMYLEDLTLCERILSGELPRTVEAAGAGIRERVEEDMTIEACENELKSWFSAVRKKYGIEDRIS